MIPVVTLRADRLTAIPTSYVPATVEIVQGIDGQCALLAALPFKLGQPSDAWAIRMLPLEAVTGDSRGVPEDSILVTPPAGAVPLPFSVKLVSLIRIAAGLFGRGLPSKRSAIIEIEINDPSVEIGDFRLALVRWNEPRANR